MKIKWHHGCENALQIIPFFFFCFIWLGGMWNLCSLIRDWTCPTCSGRVEPWPLGNQGSPLMLVHWSFQQHLWAVKWTQVCSVFPLLLPCSASSSVFFLVQPFDSLRPLWFLNPHFYLPAATGCHISRIRGTEWLVGFKCILIFSHWLLALF